MSLPSLKPGSSPALNICRTFSALQPHRSARISGVKGLGWRPGDQRSGGGGGAEEGEGCGG